jgi:hypothetical protein
LCYNQCDSYLLAKELLSLIKETKKAIREKRLDEWKHMLVAIKEMNDDKPPTEEDIEKLRPYANLGVSQQSTCDWYCLTRETQGSL